MGGNRYKTETKSNQKELEYGRQYKKRVMDEVIAHYSNGLNICAKCGIAYREFLTLDHIDAEPDKLSEMLGIKSTGGYGLAHALRARNYPEGIQILCYNCNMVKGSHIKNNGKSRLKDRSHITIEYKTCSKCGITKHADLFPLNINSKDGLSSYCYDCNRLNSKNYRIIRVQKLYNIIGLNNCSCCMDNRIEVLSIEHSNNDGVFHRLDIQQRYNLKNYKDLGGERLALYVLRDLKAGIPLWNGLTLHCRNCNCSKGFHGYCPHDLEKGIKPTWMLN